MRKWLSMISILILTGFFSGCAQLPLGEQKSVTDPSLPQVEGLRALSDIEGIALEWKPLYDTRIQGYYIYRGSAKEMELARVAVIKDKFSSHYVDKGLSSNTTYNYKISAFADNDRESLPSELLTVQTLPPLESVSYLSAVDNLPRMVKLIWRPHIYNKVSQYIIERSEPDSGEWERVGVVEGRLQAEYIDKKLQDNHVYLYRVKVKTFDGIVSTPSAVVKAKTKPLPATVRGLKASRGEPRKIMVSWERLDDPEVTSYKVYSSPFSVGIYTHLITTKADQTQITDRVEKDGVSRYYKITAISKDGLEGLMQESPVMGTTLEKPLPPVISSVQKEGGQVVLSWIPGDNRTKSYAVIKKIKTGFLTSEEVKFTKITMTSIVDRGVSAGTQYTYSVVGIDEFGIESEPSKEVVVEMPAPKR